MSNKTQASAHDALQDPLSSSSHTAKRQMLVFSCIALLIVLTGVSPDEVSVFGLKFPGLTLSILNQGILWLLGISIFSFIIYGTSDLLRFRHRIDVYNRCRASDIDAASLEDPSSYAAQERRHFEQEFESMTGYKPYEIGNAPAKTLVGTRFLIDFIAPLLFGVVCIGLFAVKHVLGPTGTG